MSGLLFNFSQIIYKIEIGQGDARMELKSQLEVPGHRPLAQRSWEKRQTSDEELEEVRKRGRYVVLPPVEGPQEDDWDDWPDLIL
jgi:hypothetical protein